MTVLEFRNFERELLRNYITGKWKLSIFSHIPADPSAQEDFKSEYGGRSRGEAPRKKFLKEKHCKVI